MFNTSGHGREQLRELLHQYNEYPERRDEIIANINQDYEQTVAVLIMDSCGFSRTVHEHGIVHFMALLERLWRLVEPAVDEFGGRPLREDADNLYAVFPDVRSAVECAKAIHERVEIANGPLPAANEIYVALGIGYGPLLLVGENDAWGDEMNLACKLGEDIAEGGEVLLTEDARRALGDDGSDSFETLELSVSGLEMTAYRLVNAQP
jgi:class 3 adenylate cyclase